MGLWNFIFWWGSLPLQVALMALMARWRSFKKFPWFFAYTAYSIVATGLRILVLHKSKFYFYVYWISDGVYAIVGIAVMYEVFRRVFHPILRTRWVRAVFPALVVLALGLTLLRTASTRAETGSIMLWIAGAEMGTRITEVIMFIVLVALVALFGLRWRQHEFGICAGFGIYASTELLASTKYYEIGSRFNFSWSVISVVSYTVAVLIWLWYFSTPVRAEAPNSEQPPLSLPALERYKEIVRRVPRP